MEYDDCKESEFVIAAKCLRAFGSMSLSIAIAAIAQQARAMQPLHYETPVLLTGVLVTEAYYGPPNWGEDPATDTKEVGFILRLDSPISVIATSNKGSDLDSYEGERRILVNNDPSVQNLSKLVGHQITVAGLLYDKVTVRDLTDVCMYLTAVITPKEVSR